MKIYVDGYILIFVCTFIGITQQINGKKKNLICTDQCVFCLFQELCKYHLIKNLCIQIGSPLVNINTCFNGGILGIDVNSIRCRCAVGSQGTYCHLGNGDELLLRYILMKKCCKTTTKLILFYAYNYE